MLKAVCGHLDVKEELGEKSKIKTEPDIMLHVPRLAIVLIEAKFGSPNSPFKPKKERFVVTDFLGQYRYKNGAPRQG